MTYDELIAYYGSQAEAARRLGLKQPSIFDWKESTIPYDRQCQIQIETDGQLIARREDDEREVRKAREAAA
jgi:hypothetical protein